MKRVGNADTISDIEFVIDQPPLGDPRHTWTVHGVECTRDRHRYSGPAYEFNIEILDLRRGGRSPWHVVIVSEWWHAAGTKGEIRNSKWLKVVSGKASDVKTWMRNCRSLKVDKNAGSHVVEI
jgi:hypothetical protein